MKYAFAILFSLMFLQAKAGNGDKFVTANAGYLYRNILHASLGYEVEQSYGKAYEFALEFGNQMQRDTLTGSISKDSFWKGYYWNGSAAYKLPLKKYKNSRLLARVGVMAGAYTGHWNFGLEAGLEYDYVFPSGLVFTVTQKNQVYFRYGETFRNGLLVGLKVPL